MKDELEKRRAELVGCLAITQSRRQAVEGDLRNLQETEAALVARIEELDRVLALLREMPAVTPAKPRRPKRKIPELVLGLIRDAGSDGITVGKLLETAEIKPSRLWLVIEELSAAKQIARVSGDNLVANPFGA